MVTPAQIEAWNIGKTFGTARVLDGITLRIGKGEFLSLLGPSGSGKTTFLTILAGFLAPTDGSMILNGRDITELPAEKRGFGMVFQGYALFPHMTVAENIAFPLKVQKRAPAAIQARVADMVEMVGLHGHAHKKPGQLSGGQQQRVALARALAYEPQVLLLDEPFSALDKNLRGQMQQELRRLHRELGTTFVFVTHDQQEALSMSTHVAIFNQGRLQQIGSPEDVYSRPSNRFVAEFLGEINVLALDWRGGVAFACGQPVAIVQECSGMPKTLAIRPEHLRVVPADYTGNQLRLRVMDRVYLGSTTQLHLSTTTGDTVVLNLPTCGRSADLFVGSEIVVGWEAADSLYF